MTSVYSRRELVVLQKSLSFQSQHFLVFRESISLCFKRRPLWGRKIRTFHWSHRKTKETILRLRSVMNWMMSSGQKWRLRLDQTWMSYRDREPLTMKYYVLRSSNWRISAIVERQKKGSCASRCKICSSKRKRMRWRSRKY